MGALVAFGLPLLLVIATTARSLVAQSAAAGSIPLLALCGYLTFSRGGALASALALVVFITLAPNRLPKLATVFASAGGAAIIIAGAVHRSAIERGLANAAASHQGGTLFAALVLVCLGVASVQAAIGLALRRSALGRVLVVSPRRAQTVLTVAIAGAIVIALAADAPSRLSHLWHDFKRPQTALLAERSLNRFGATSGNGRYDFWKAAIDASASHPFIGSGPGSFQLLWLPRAPDTDYVVNAHSLYIETYAEEGLIGLALLGGFFVLVLWRSVRVAIRSRDEQRACAAGVDRGTRSIHVLRRA